MSRYCQHLCSEVCLSSAVASCWTVGVGWRPYIRSVCHCSKGLTIKHLDGHSTPGELFLFSVAPYLLDIHLAISIYISIYHSSYLYMLPCIGLLASCKLFTFFNRFVLCMSVSIYLPMYQSIYTYIFFLCHNRASHYLYVPLTHSKRRYVHPLLRENV